MSERIRITKISRVFKKFLKSGIYRKDNDHTLIFYDLDFLKVRTARLKKSFPPNTLHTVAVKANPLVQSLKFFKKMGLGAEAASVGELYLAYKCGFKPSEIVFDSPVKTFKEIEYALKLGVYINADSLAELKRINKLMKKIKSDSRVGIRINPQVGESKIKMSSVAGKYSKFGVPINEFKKELSDCFMKYKWLKGVHLHVGSQGCSLEMLVKGIGVVYEFAEETNQLLKRKNIQNKIDVFDIGGGLPAVYSEKENGISLKKYAGEIKSKYPKLFTSEYKLITELGRWMNANSGWTASRIEYVKRFKKINTVMIHAGADLFLRRAYSPNYWHHDLSLLDSGGHIKKRPEENKYVIAGPLCFAGDVLAKGITLPIAEEDDFIIIHDTGAYTLSMWSRYNSRLIPKVVGYSVKRDIKFSVMKKKETLQDLYRFWS